METKTEELDPWDNPQHERLKTRPVCSDVDYLHYSDLNEFIKRFASGEKIAVLDYGAGASPYRKYFPDADYRRADITGVSSLHYRINPDSTIHEADGTFDVILSTQVAEHVPNPDVYFRECFRLLKKGGRLILTTHGVWEEHGSPYDFQRWTGTGLRRDLRNAGFQRMRIFKLTCGLRAMVLLFSRMLFAATPPLSPIRRFAFKAFRWPYSKCFPILHRIADRWWPDDRIVEEHEGDSSPIWYLVIAAIAEK